MEHIKRKEDKPHKKS